MAEPAAARVPDAAPAVSAPRALKPAAGDGKAAFGYLCLDTAGRVVEVNDEFARVLGVPAHELVGVNVWNAFPEARKSRFHDEFTRVLDEDRPVAFEEFYAPLELWLSVQGFPASQGVAVFMRDITRQKRAQAKLSEQEAKYRALVEQIPLVSYVNAPGREIRTVYMSPQVEELLGYPAGDWLEPGFWASVLHPDDREALLAQTAHTHTTGERFHAEYRMLARDGSAVWVQDETIAIRDETGECRFFQGFLLDISERKRLEEQERRAQDELREAERRYRVLVEQLPLVTYVNARERGPLTTYMSPQVETLLGYPADEWLKPRFWASVIHPDDREWVLAAGDRAHAACEPFEAEYRLLARDGSVVWVLDETVPVYDERGECHSFQGFILDVTQQKRLEEQLLSAQRAEALGRLAGGVAHDFNNLLLAISGYGTLLAAALGSDRRLREYADEIVRTTGRAATLTRQLLAYSRKQVLSPEVVDLNEVVDQLTAMLPRVIGEHIDVVTDLSDHPALIKADRGQLEQVIMNLAVNARDAMSDGGDLRIATRRATLDRADGEALDVAPGRYVVLEVSDTGCGMDESTQKHLFEPFFTTKEIGKGTGLGLASVYGIVRQSGGQITVESELGRGSVFTIFLAEERGASPAEPAPTVAPLPERGSETVLLVEDDDVVRQLVRRALEESGYDVLEASSGEDALALSDGYGGEIALLVTDVVMPGLSGVDVAERLVVARPETTVLFMSGYPGGAVGERPHLPQGSNFIQKPFGLADFGREVRRLIDGRR